MGLVSASILLVFLCSALATDAFSWSECSCGATSCPPGCKPQQVRLGGPYSSYCYCGCNCNPSYNPPETPPTVPTNPPPTVPTNPPPTVPVTPPSKNVPPPPKSSPPQPPKSPLPPPVEYRPPSSGGRGNLFDCLGILNSFTKCLSEIGNLFFGKDLDPGCCDIFARFNKSCANGANVLPPAVQQYCQNH